MNQHQRWTQTDIADLRTGVANGLAAEAIAEGMGRTVDDVSNMASRLRLRMAK